MSRNSVLWRGNAFWVEGVEGNEEKREGVEGDAKIPGGGGGEAPLRTPPLRSSRPDLEIPPSESFPLQLSRRPIILNS